MPDNTARSPHPVRTDSDVVRLVEGLVHTASRRQCWLLFVAQDRRTIDLVMPIADLPQQVHDDDVDHVAQTMAQVFRQLRSLFVVVAWESPGARHLDLRAWEWVHAIEVAFADAGVQVRGQTLVHDGGVDWLDVDGGVDAGPSAIDAGRRAGPLEPHAAARDLRWSA